MNSEGNWHPALAMTAHHWQHFHLGHAFINLSKAGGSIAISGIVFSLTWYVLTEILQVYIEISADLAFPKCVSLTVNPEEFLLSPSGISENKIVSVISHSEATDQASG